MQEYSIVRDSQFDIPGLHYKAYEGRYEKLIGYY
jgi:hypothetical protein